jgi:hypothetical protein
MACLRLFTRPPFPPFPERKVPFFLRRIALLTDFLDARPYLAISTSSILAAGSRLRGVQPATLCRGLRLTR